MPTIAEIIAAKKAKEAATNTMPAAASLESIQDAIENKAAIDRIDPPGKSSAAASARKMTGLILNRDMPCTPEARGQATPIAGPTQEPEHRSLGRTEGEAISLVPVNADQRTATWHAAVNAFESEMCLMLDPKAPERAWIAIRLDGQEEWPILLKSLPLYQHPRMERSTNEPF